MFSKKDTFNLSINNTAYQICILISRMTNQSIYAVLYHITIPYHIAHQTNFL